MRHSPKLFEEIVSLFSASCPFGKLSVRQNARSAKCPFGKTSVRQNVRSAKRPSAKCPFGKMSFGKMSFGKLSFGKMSGYLNMSLWLGRLGDHFLRYSTLNKSKNINFSSSNHSYQIQQMRLISQAWYSSSTCMHACMHA